MRPLYIIGGSIAVLAIAGVLAWTRFAPAQVPAPSQPLGPGEDMTITAPEVEVRSGPSNSFYATSKLRAGDKVKVYAKHEKATAGWLVIEPPAGSRSWINAAYVKRSQDNPSQGYVVTDPDRPVPVKPASSISDKEPDVETVKIQRGTLVVVLGKEMFGGNAAWLPIQPPAGDVRFIPDSAVAKNQPLQPTPNPGATGFVAPPGGDQSIAAQAEAKRQEFIQSCRMVLVQSSDPAAKAQAQAFLTALEKAPIPQGAIQQPGFPNYNASTAPGVNIGGGVTPGQTTGGNTALYNATNVSSDATWTKWGTLRKTTYQKDGLPMYRLDDEKGAPIGYALAAAGLTLEPYVGKVVCLYGPTAYRSDDAALRVNYTIVRQLSLADR
ncbi:MAG TPA: hypothetical protein VE988_25985 [Gemmataceae bacterium]|nr:hypothetical protein [Gemmataceae bacterium]